MSDQSFCLKWDGFHGSVTSVFECLRQQNELVDVTLCCHGFSIPAHRVILSACSPYFRGVLKSRCQHMVFYMKDTSASDLRALVEFMYKGSVNVSQNQLASFIRTAEALQIRGLSGEDDASKEAPAAAGAASPPMSTSSVDNHSANTVNTAAAAVPAAAASDFACSVSPPVTGSLTPEDRGHHASPEVAAHPAKRRRPAPPTCDVLPSDHAAHKRGTASLCYEMIDVDANTASVVQPSLLLPSASSASSSSCALLPDVEYPPPPPSTSPPAAAAAAAAAAPHVAKQEPDRLKDDQETIDLEQQQHQQQQDQHTHHGVHAVLETTLEHVDEYERAALLAHRPISDSEDAGSGETRQPAPGFDPELCSAQYADNAANTQGVVFSDVNGGLPVAPHSCPECGRSYMARNSLRDHMAIHMGRTMCPICSKVCSSVGNLRKHIVSAHNVAPEDVRQILPAFTRTSL